MPSTTAHMNMPIDLINIWSVQSKVSTLPVHIQEALSYKRNVRNLRLIAALLNEDEEDGIPLKEDELGRAHAGTQ